MTAGSESVGGMLCDVVDLLRGALALIDSFEGRDGSDELLAARTLTRLALDRTAEAQALDDAREMAARMSDQT